MNQADKQELVDALRQIAVLIPFGRVTTYGTLAKSCGFPNHSRLVGRLLSDCAVSEGIPAHRIVGSGGKLNAASLFGAAGRLEQLLAQEGIDVKEGRIRGFKIVFWDPQIELCKE